MNHKLNQLIIVSFFICLSFLFSTSTTAQCVIADLCDEISTAQTLNIAPADLNCQIFDNIKIESCLEDANPETDIVTCMSDSLPTVWLRIVTDVNAKNLVLAIEPAGSWTPIWSVYSGTCNNLIQETATDANGQSVECGLGMSSYQIAMDGFTNNTFYVAVSGQGQIDDPNFSLSAFATSDCIVCIGDLGNCETEADFFVIDRSIDSFPIDTDGDGVDGPFFPGEEVTFCIDYFYDASDTGSDWLIGMVPSFGSGWDLEASNIQDQSIGGQWEWYEAGGSCAPIIQEQMPNLCTYTDAQGRLQMCNVLCEYCPCTAPLIEQSPLPSGWFWVTNGGGAGCANDCSPGEGYGTGSVAITIEFCLTLTVKEEVGTDCQMNDDLSINFQTFSDETAGCWDDPTGECRIDNKQMGPEWKVDCGNSEECLEGGDFPPQFQCSCEDVEHNLPNLVICDLAILDGYVGKMSPIITGNGPNPLCSAGGTPQNISWFGFVAPQGDFDIEIEPMSCTPGGGGQLGIKAGIYADCSFNQEIWCATIPCSTDPINTADGNIDWVEGQTYYLFLDGCAGSVCDFQLNVVCNSQNCDPFQFEPDLGISLQTCDSNLVDLDNGLCLGETYELFTNAYNELDLKKNWRIIDPIGQVEEFENVSGALTYNFFQTGTYSIELVLDNNCAIIQDVMNVNVAVSGPIQFEPISVCEGEMITPEMTIDSIDYFWEQPIQVPVYDEGGDNVHSFTETFDGQCDCITQLNVDIEVLPNGVLNDTLYAVESDFPIDYNGFQISGPVDPFTIILEQAAANGCDSIINLTVFVSTDVLDIDNSEIYIYPNPSNGLINIQHNSNIHFDRLEVIDIHGRSVKSMLYIEFIDVSDLPSGLYFLRILDKEGVGYHRNFIVTK